MGQLPLELENDGSKNALLSCDVAQARVMCKELAKWGWRAFQLGLRLNAWYSITAGEGPCPGSE